MTNHGCKRQLDAPDIWYFWHPSKGLQDLGWTASHHEHVYCGQVSYRSDEAIRLCESCLRRKGIIW